MRARLPLLPAVLLAACASASGSPQLAEPYVAVAPTVAASPTTTPSSPAPTATTPPEGVIRVEHVPFTSDLELDVHAPASGTSRGVAVLVHGGGWIVGHRYTMSRLADALAERGVVTFNVDYRTLSNGGGYPVTFEDVACAVRFSRSTAATTYGEGGPVMLVGHSAGGHLASVVALSGDRYHGDCVVDEGSALPEALLGIAGPYDPSGFRVPLGSFFGGTPETVPENWAAGDPFQLLGENPGLVVRLVSAGNDRVVPSWYATSFEEALLAAGYDAALTEVPGASHVSIRNPSSDGIVVVDLVVKTLDSVTSRISSGHAASGQMRGAFARQSR